MTPEQFKRAESLFNDARALGVEERSAFLSKACPDDPLLRGRVERMLYRATQPMDEIPSRARTSLLGGLAEILTEQTLGGEEIRQIGNYKIIRKLGEGGMGVVYEAAQDNPRRTVALKVVRPGLGGGNLLRRFKKEAELLGQLQHPGIACIYEAGVGEVRSEDGTVLRKQPFYAMEYVRGEALHRYCGRRELSVREQMELMVRIAEAVQHAHEKGVIHRDLKPANILIVDSSRDRKEGGGSRASFKSGSFRGSDTYLLPDVQPKILDFGIARTTNVDMQTMTLQTDVGQLVGTVPYMSPEQVAGDSRQLDARTDVYSLGVILYETLAGKLPLDVRNRSIPEAARIIREDDPSRLSSINTRLRGDIETIVAKAMEKDKVRRYSSAADFAADIRRYLRDEPLRARPASTFYQWQKFAKRHKGLVAGIAMTIVALSAGLAGTLGMAVRERDQRQRAERANTRSEIEAYKANLAAASAAVRLEDGAAARRHLNAVPPERRGWEWKHINWLADRSNVTLVGHKSPPWSNRFLSTPGQFATVSDDGDFRVWDIATGECLRRAQMPQSGRISPDARYVLALRENRYTVWNTQTQQRAFELPGSIEPMDPFSPDGKLVYLGSPGAMIGAYELATGRCLRTIKAPDLCGRLQVGPDGSKLLWDGARRMGAIDLDNGSSWEAAGAYAQFTDTGNVLARDDSLKFAIFDVLTGRTIETLDYIDTQTALGRHSRDIQFGGGNGLNLYHRWRDKSEEVPLVLTASGLTLDEPTHRWAIVDGCTVKIGDSRMIRAPFSIPGCRANTSAFNATGTRVAGFGWGEVTLRNTITGAELWSKFISLQHLIGGAFSLDGARIAAIGQDGPVHFLNAEDGTVIRTQNVPSGGVAVAYRPDGSSLCIGCLDGFIREFHPASGQLIREWRAHEGPIRCLTMSPDGEWIFSGSATASFDLPLHVGVERKVAAAEARIWEADTGNLVKECYSGPQNVLLVAFAGDGSKLAWVCADGNGQISNPPKGNTPDRATVAIHISEPPAAMALNFDARRLAVAGQSGVHIFDVRTGDDLAVLTPGIQDQYSAAAWRGDTLMTAAWQRHLVAYEIQSPDCDANDRYLASISDALVGSGCADISKKPADLEKRSDLPDEIRQAALRTVRARDDHPNYLASEAWAILRGSDRKKEEYEKALRLMTIACGVRPDSPGLRHGLGVAQFRVGLWTDALASFAACDQQRVATASLTAVAQRTPDVDVRLISAMCHWHLGDNNIASDEMKRGEALANSPDFTTDPMVQSLLREASLLFAAERKTLR